jgi:beta-galactosidase/beta-glucuronidase
MHRIRLIGPWEYEWLGDAAVNAPSGQVRMPRDWRELFGDAYGTARFVRRFGRPTNLDENERVRLVFDGIGGAAVVQLNGVELGRVNLANRRAAFDITRRLHARNELAVTLTVDTPLVDAGLWGVVALDIDSPDDGD